MWAAWTFAWRRGRSRGGVEIGVGGEGVSTDVGVDVDGVVMGLDGVFVGVGGAVMRAVGVDTGGMDAMIYKSVAAAPEVSLGAPLQIHLRQ